MRNQHWKLAAAICAGTFVACGLTACGSSAAPGAPVPADDLIHQLLAAECPLLVRCHWISDEALCEAYLNPPFTQVGFGSLAAAVAAAKAGKTKYDAAAGRACVTAVGTATCDDLPDFSRTIGPACKAVFTGAMADGAACVVDEECTPGSFCRASRSVANEATCAGICTRGGLSCNDDSHCGTNQICDKIAPDASGLGTCIAAMPPGAANQPCGTNRRCEAALYCSRSSSPEICKPLVKAGGVCDTTFSCADGLPCIPNTTTAGSTVTGTCMGVVAKGEVCVSSFQCGGFVSTNICDPMFHICVDAPQSGPCPTNSSTAGCSPLTSFCDRSTTTPTCKPIVPIGGACSRTSDACGPFGATCVGATATAATGVCTAPLACAP